MTELGDNHRRLGPGSALVLAAAIFVSAIGSVRVSANAQRDDEIILDGSADRTAITVGDPITLTVRLVYPPGTKILTFAPEEAMSTLAILGGEAGAPREDEEGRVEEIRTLRVTLYKTGEAEIPSFEVTYVGADDRQGSVASRPIRFEVTSVLAENDAEPADIKPPSVMAEGLPWPWLLLLAAVGAVAWYIWRRRRPASPSGEPATAIPARPPHEIAYVELERLLSGDLLSGGRFKEFYIELSEIIRRYVGARFGIETFERTSSEILDGLREARIATTGLDFFRVFFTACDLVKFAKYRPEADETRLTVEVAYRLVDETKSVESIPSEMEPAA